MIICQRLPTLPTAEAVPAAEIDRAANADTINGLSAAL